MEPPKCFSDRDYSIKLDDGIRWSGAQVLSGRSGLQWLLWGAASTGGQIGSCGSNPVVHVPRKTGVARCPAKGQSLASNGHSATSETL